MDNKDMRYYVIPFINPALDIYSVLVVDEISHALEDMMHAGQNITPQRAEGYVAYLSHSDSLRAYQTHRLDIAMVLEELYLTSLCKKCQEAYVADLKCAGDHCYEIMAKRKPWTLLAIACGFSKNDYTSSGRNRAFQVAASGSFLVRKISDTEYSMRYIECPINVRTSNSITVIYEGINGSESTAREIDYIFSEDVEPYHQGVLGWNRGVLELTNVKRLIDYATGKVSGVTVTVDDGPMDEE